jgi:3-oxoacyl-[acyl-carrier protein] reductase
LTTSSIAPGAVVLITGSTGGIGFEIAAQAAEGGAVVGVHGSRSETVERAIARLLARYPNARLIAAPGDFLKPGVIDAVVDKIVSQGGRLDAVIHCAITGSSGTSGPFRTTNPRNFGMLAQAILGVFQELCFAAVPHLAQNGGTIVAFASDAGRFAAPRQTMHGAAFGGIMTFVRNLAVDVSRDGVRVHCISPTFVVDTPVFEAFASVGDRGNRARERAGLGLPSPKDIAPMALFLCGPGAEKITGQIISINGGLNA